MRISWSRMVEPRLHTVCVQPVTFWWPVCCSNHWGALTEMVEQRLHTVCVQPVTFWWPVCCSNHWGALTEMVEQRLHTVCVQPVTYQWPVRCSNHCRNSTVYVLFDKLNCTTTIHFFYCRKSASRFMPPTARTLTNLMLYLNRKSKETKSLKNFLK